MENCLLKFKSQLIFSLSLPWLVTKVVEKHNNPLKLMMKVAEKNKSLLCSVMKVLENKKKHKNKNNKIWIKILLTKIKLQKALLKSSSPTETLQTLLTLNLRHQKATHMNPTKKNKIRKMSRTTPNPNKMPATQTAAIIDLQVSKFSILFI